MNYSEFLFVQLLMANSAVVSICPYDEIWNAYEDVYNDYEGSAFNVDDKGEYLCMEEYIDTYIQKIDNTFRKFI